MKSQTLYNECALEIRKRFGGRKNFKEKYITILTCKKLRNIMECKSNLKNFLESVYSNLKNPTNSCWIQVTLQGISRETYCWKIFLDFNFLNSMCNEIEGNIDLRKCYSILGILVKQNNTFLTQKRYDTRSGVTLWNSNTNS